MSAPYRITRPRELRRVGMQGSMPAEGTDFKGYLDRLMKMIPGEVAGLYLVGNGFIPTTDALVLAIWVVICLFAVVAVKAVGTADAASHLPADWTHVAISTISFVLWAYTMGGPFAALGVWIPYLGSLLMLAWTFFIPLFYKGADVSAPRVTASD